MSELPYGMDRLDPELAAAAVTFQTSLYRCPKCGRRTLKLRRDGFEYIDQRDVPHYGVGYFEAQCQADECDLDEQRAMVVAVDDMATACALATLYASVGKPL